MTGRVGILAPMLVEMKPILGEVRAADTLTRAGLRVTAGSLRGRDVVLAVSGVGKVNSAAATQALIDHWEVDTLILTGVSGALVPELSPGDIVIVNQLYQYDVAIIRAGRYSPLPLARRSPKGAGRRERALTASERLTKLAAERASLVKFPFQTGRRPLVVEGAVVTGDPLVLWPEALNWLSREFGAVAIEMEGAAVAQVAQANGVEFVAVRAISDRAADLARIDLEEFVGLGGAGSSLSRGRGLVSAARFLLRRPGDAPRLLRWARAMRGAARNAAAVTIELVGALE